MTRMVSGLKLNATIRVSKIPNSLPTGSQGGDLCRPDAKHVHFSCDLPGLRFLVPVGRSEKVQLDAFQIKFCRGK